MDIELLRTFIEVSRTGHFGKAANNLFITQSAVSARIKLLENTVGVPLFDRVRNNIQLTPAGRRLALYAEGIVHMWNRALQQVAVSDDSDVFLSVGGVPALWDILLEEWLERVCRSEPRIVLHADVYGPETQLRMLRDGSLDLGFMFEIPNAEGLRTAPVARIPLVLVSSEPRLSVDEALGDGYILVDWGTSFMSFHARDFSEMVPPGIRVGLGRLAHALLRHQGGAAYLAEPMVMEDLRGNRLFVVQDAPSMERHAYAVYTEDNDRRGTVEAAIHLAVLADAN
ncbi:MAG: LysR family transcriptional regulator [Gammaproteobacteria bacterium]|nr:LysR family transcriptional regulator [Gammaproteobacteria bacterium]